MQEFMRQMQQSMQQLQQTVAALQHDRSVLHASEASNPLRAATRQSLGVLLSQTPARSSASASLPRPPVIDAPIDRRSFGLPSSAFTPMPATPTVQRTVHFDNAARHSAEEQPLTHTIHAPRNGDAEWQTVAKAMSNIKEFYGQTGKDKGSVIDWVEQVDTIFSIRIPHRQQGRLDLVRERLAGTALTWMNGCVHRLNELVADKEIDGPVDWEMMRQLFIDAHLGENTIETFKAELRTLRLGSTKYPNPVEFNKEFDHMAQLAYPDRRTESMASVLGDEYGRLIYASKPAMYRQILWNSSPSTVEEWKLCVSRRWSSQKLIDAMDAASNSNGRPYNSRGGGGAKVNVNVTPALNAVTAEAETADDLDMQGEAWTEEGKDDSQQLTAANSGRSGRGQRGGKGRGGPGGRVGNRQQWDEAKKRLFEQKLCFNCKKSGHQVKDCTEPSKD